MYIKNNITSLIGRATYLPDGYSLPTQEEIDTYLLAVAKKDKTSELSQSLTAFCEAGFSYSGNIFCLRNVQHIFEAEESGENKFHTSSSVEIDFVDASSFDSFKSVLLIEKNRIMKKYHTYKKQINDCATIEAINAIAIDLVSNDN